jgi:hypothetical protein
MTAAAAVATRLRCRCEGGLDMGQDCTTGNVLQMPAFV